MTGEVPRGPGFSITQAATAVGMSRSRVDALVRSGRVRARRVGNQYVIDDLAELLALPRRPGRPMSRRMAWALLLMGDGHVPEWLTPTERRRLHGHLARLRLNPAPEVLLQALVANRASRLVFHAPEPGDLSNDERVLVSGISDNRSGVSAGSSFEGYVHDDDLSLVVRRHLLVEPVGNRPNVWLHASDFLPTTSLRLQVASDLSEHGGPRERTRARELVRQVTEQGTR